MKVSVRGRLDFAGAGLWELFLLPLHIHSRAHLKRLFSAVFAAF
jgi:hypothetical protein